MGIASMAKQVDSEFTRLIRRLIERFPSKADAARAGGVDRPTISALYHGDAKAISQERLKGMLEQLGVDPSLTKDLRLAHFHETEDRAKVELVTAAQGDGMMSITSGRTKFTRWSRPADVGAALYREWVPVEGSLSPDGGFLPVAEDMPDEERLYLAFPPVPEGSIALKIDADIEGFARGSYLVFGPETAPAEAGLGLFEFVVPPPGSPAREMTATPAEAIVRFERAGRDLRLFFDKGTVRIPRDAIRSFRAFVGAA